MFADKDEFKLFLTDGRNEMHNMAIKRYFRHIVNSSHEATQNLAFMYSLYESCK